MMRTLNTQELNIISGGEFDYTGLMVGGATGVAAVGLKLYQGASFISTALWGMGGFVLGAGAYYGGTAAYRYAVGQ